MLKLENVSKYYYSSSSVCCALRKINLQFDIGEFVAITGESGSGKTTLLNIISGFDSYEEGEITFNENQTSYFDDEDWERYRKNEIAFIFQQYNLIDSYSVLENVMVTYILEGVAIEEAKAKSLEILKKVGLEKDVFKKTTKLSGGQKQRLAIARALAKETNIIVADEPTGNLDDENGHAILNILKKLSSDKLVIIVTHNQSQAEPYITRKVRLHDGEVVSDEIINETSLNEIKPITKEEKKNIKKVINFSFLNFKSQPTRVLLLFMIFLLCVVSSFVFLVNFKANINDSKTKVLSNELFVNFDDTRMLVRTFNQDVITDELLQGAKIDKVVSLEKYDYITDTNYFRPTDYKYVIQNGYLDPMDPVTIDLSYYKLQDFSHFMRSAASLTEDMLKWGRLPENPYEMVVYSNDDSLLNTTETVMFNNQKKWNAGRMYRYDLKIVGILKEPSNQAYFSDQLCKVLDLVNCSFNICINYMVLQNGRYVYKRLYVDQIVLDPNIGDYDFSFSNALIEDAKSYIINNVVINNGKENVTYNFNFNQTNGHNVDSNALGVSEDILNMIYANFSEKKQFAIFIEDYAYINEVKEGLIELGYDSISCFESSAQGYDISKVITRYINLAISVVAFILINVIAVLLVYTIMKFKKNDYLIFKMNGMSHDLCKKINAFEISIYGGLSYLISSIIVIIFSLTTKNQILINSLKYLRYYDYLIILFTTIITVWCIVHLYSKYLKNRVKISAMRED